MMTRQDEYLIKYPNSPRDENGILNICPTGLNMQKMIESCGEEQCKRCRKLMWLEEIE